MRDANARAVAEIFMVVLFLFFGHNSGSSFFEQKTSELFAMMNQSPDAPGMSRTLIFRFSDSQAFYYDCDCDCTDAKTAQMTKRASSFFHDQC